MKSLREQIENPQSEICLLRKEMKEKNALLKVIIHSKGSSREMTLSSPIYRQYQSKNTFEKIPFHEQNMPESPQEQFTDPSNRAGKFYIRRNNNKVDSIETGRIVIAEVI